MHIPIGFVKAFEITWDTFMVEVLDVLGNAAW